VTNRLQIVTARLLDTLMRVDRRVARRAGQVLAVLVGDMFALAVFKALSESEVNNVDLVFGLVRSPNQKIVRLDVAMNYPLFMHLLDAHQLDIYRLARRCGLFEMKKVDTLLEIQNLPSASRSIGLF
jgi:hypothetical protein